ncbi:MAG: hypothetical protein CHACPFDD_01015 [Phycisphaerae bacterium]|nr:hypothetical protein [Phycisphaerae bacterium]
MLEASQPNEPQVLRRAALLLSLVLLPGCTWIAHLGTDLRGEPFGKTFYLGGAGTLGHVGTLDVPNGLRDAGYRGAIEVFGWQSWVGGTLRDQLDQERNLEEAVRFAQRIEDYARRYPNRRINIIALSGGTGIATWALEGLSSRVRIGNIAYLSSSLSRDYDLTKALRRVDGRLYSFHSKTDPVLLAMVPLAGTIDRQFSLNNIAGLRGFAVPRRSSAAVREVYAQRVRNIPWREEFAEYGYLGGHTGATTRAFVARFVAPLIIGTGTQSTGAEPAPPGGESPPETEPDEPAPTSDG